MYEKSTPDPDHMINEANPTTSDFKTTTPALFNFFNQITTLYISLLD
jgi:hypothetical protein